MESIIATTENYRFSNDPRELGIAGLAATARKVEEVGFDWILTAETRGQDSFFPLPLPPNTPSALGYLRASPLPSPASRW